MEQAWIIMGETYLLTIVISLFVAFLIHMMTLLIRRFGTAAKPLPVSAEQVEISAQPDDPDELAALRGIRPLFRGDGGRPDAGRRPVAEKLRDMKLERVASFAGTRLLVSIPVKRDFEGKI